ncbi:hypothetical protein UlMin_012692 [Ulmus minor]
MPNEEPPEPIPEKSYEPEDEDSSDESNSDSDSDFDSSDSEAEEGKPKEEEDSSLTYTRPIDLLPETDDNSPETNVKMFSQVLESKRMRKAIEEEEREYVFYEDLFDFPEDPENWNEEDLQELWADAPIGMGKPGWDPVWADEDDWEIVNKEIAAGRDPPIAPFYLPYRRPYPVIPDDHHDISNPKAVVEELDRIEEFLTWVSFVFQDGSSYEGTVWDDLKQGKGVFVGEQGLVRYEGEWLQNEMEGHGVVEVDIPDIEPVPGSKLEAQMRAEGKIISRDYMSDEDREWLEKDIEDSMLMGKYEIPFYENDEWIRQFGRKPEVGRYRYAGQWKHGRMHGCGVYEVNERTIFGRFYFGELLEDSTACDEETSALHSGIAEVAAAKARMFVNKPDGMVREERGPYSDPQHPYFYEEEDVWMAPGFINQFYEVPDYWKTYVDEVDKEREMWLNSFYKAPLRLPMPAELEYWWENDELPEFILINKEPEPDPNDPSKLVYTEDPLILHTPTGGIINYIEDEEHGLRLFWQPILEEGEDVDPEKVEFLPLGFDEFYGRVKEEKKENFLERLMSGIDNTFKPVFDKLEKWAEEQQKASELKMQLIEKELELIEAELCLEEAIEDIDEELKRKEKEEEKEAEKKVETGFPEKTEDTSALAKKDEKSLVQEEEEEEEDEEDDGSDDDADDPSSFGSAASNRDQNKNDKRGSKPKQSPFSTASLSFASSSLISGVPTWLQQSFSLWKKTRPMAKPNPPSHVQCQGGLTVGSVSFPPMLSTKGKLIAKSQTPEFRAKTNSSGRTAQLHSLSRLLSRTSDFVKPRRSTKHERAKSHPWLHMAPESELEGILSLQIPVHYLNQNKETKCGESFAIPL